MKSKICILLLLTILVIGVSGCSKTVSGNNVTSTDSKQTNSEIDFKKPEKFLDKAQEVYLNHYCYGFRGSAVNKWVRTLEQYKPEGSFFNIFVYPHSNEEIIAQTAETIYNVDRLLADNDDYEDYCDENGVPYHIDLYCLDTCYDSIDLTGKHTLEDIKETISDNLEAVSDTVMAPLLPFYEELDKMEGLNKDDEGNYFFILDTKNFDESSRAILDKVKEVNKINPLPESVWENYSDAQAALGYLDKGYTVYKDSVNPDNLVYTENFKVNMRFPLIWMFLSVTGQSHAKGTEEVKLGSAPDDIQGDAFYSGFTSEPDGSVSAFITMNGKDEGPYDRDTVVGYAVDYINDLLDVLNEHNIKSLKSIGITSDFAHTGELRWSADFDAPLDDKYTVERLNAMIDKNGSEYNPADYILGDDCF